MMIEKITTNIKRKKYLITYYTPTKMIEIDAIDAEEIKRLLETEGVCGEILDIKDIDDLPCNVPNYFDIDLLDSDGDIVEEIEHGLTINHVGEVEDGK